MKIVYIGQYSHGTTSKMRADHIFKILKPSSFEVIDTNIPFYDTVRPIRSFGFRFKKGPLIKRVNEFILAQIENKSYVSTFDLIWIDKGIFLRPSTVKSLKKKTLRLVHFTPDMAFYENKSRKFENALGFYDYAITTKSAEVDNYLNLIDKKKLILTTQGFSKDVHFPRVSFHKKENSVAFIGLAEESRFEIAQKLIENKIPLKVAGMGWEKFVRKNNGNSFISYYGNGIFSEDYSKFISTSRFALGLLNKNFPELHTTRTFEIPACGTALLTERNKETASFFRADEAIFYDSPEDLIEKVKYYNANNEKLEELTANGNNKVYQNGYDYESILHKVLIQVLA